MSDDHSPAGTAALADSGHRVDCLRLPSTAIRSSARLVVQVRQRDDETVLCRPVARSPLSLEAPFEGHEVFYIVAPDTIIDVPSLELAARFFLDVPIRGPHRVPEFFHYGESLDA